MQHPIIPLAINDYGLLIFFGASLIIGKNKSKSWEFSKLAYWLISVIEVIQATGKPSWNEGIMICVSLHVPIPVTIYSVELFLGLNFKPSEGEVVIAAVPVGILAISSLFSVHAPIINDKTRSKINV